MSSTAAPRPKPWIDAIAPYIPGKSSSDDGIVSAKLSANENPLGTSPAARAAFAAAADTLGRYPDGSATALREAILTRPDKGSPERFISAAYVPIHTAE